MAFFDDLGKKISQTSQSAVKKTKNIADITKLNLQISEEQKKLDGFYLQIGKEYVANYKENPDSNLSDLVGNATEIETKIASLNDQIREIKGILCCEKCGKEIAKGSSFCMNCGEPVPKVEKEVPSDTTPCPNCANPVKNGTNFCTFCGTAVNNNQEAEPVAQNDKKICPSCNTQNNQDAVFCVGCGNKF